MAPISRWAWTALFTTLGNSFVRADCECGYSVDSPPTKSTDSHRYTELIESNFLTIQNISRDTDWRIQDYDSKNRRPYGRSATPANVISNPVTDNETLSGPGILGGPAGLQLWVSGGPPINDLVKSAEIATRRKDILYGSFRVAVRLTPVNGTCSALFTYGNDTQEIDIEMLSRYYAAPSNPPQSPLNFVLHSSQSIQQGSQEPNTTDYGKPIVPVDLTDGFHEMRFDWMPGVVSFFLDGQWLWDLESPNVPVLPSPFLLSHWSDGAQGWSLGPPTVDAVMTVSYFKAYFNSSDPQRARDLAARCTDIERPGALCTVPDQIGAPNATEPGAVQGNFTGTGAGTFFFSEQKNLTVNQTVYPGNPDGRSGHSGSKDAETNAASRYSWSFGTFVGIGFGVILCL